MARRTLLGCLLLVCAAIGCKDNGDGTSTAPGGAADLDTQCERLAKVCADTAKHVEKMIGECKQVATQQVASGCTAKAAALYSCYIKDVCGGADKVWALDDLRVLAERHGKCAPERAAIADCGKK